MNAIDFASIKKTNWRHTLRLCMGILALFMAGALLFTSCKKSEEGEGGEGGEKAAKGQAEYKKGLAAFEKKEYEDAVKSFKKAADKGNAEAMLVYAACLGTGKGIEKDKDEADNWLQKAADAGDATAQAVYAAKIKDSDKEKTFEYLKKSADQNSLLGQFMLGVAYIAEDNEADTKKGLDYVRKVAEQSLTNEKTVLDYFEDELPIADAFSGTSGIDIDLPEDKQNFSNYLIVASQMLLSGVYMKQEDFAEAKKWLRKAGDNGFSQADDLLPLVEMAEKESKSKKR